MLNSIVVEPTQAIFGSVICLHGLGASGQDLAPLAPHMQLPDVRFIFPDAPVRPITIFGGDQARAWYDITTLEESPKRESWTHVLESEILIQDLIQKEIDKGVPARNIAIMGFSQGAAMALQIVHRYPESLLMAIVMSGYLLNPDLFAEGRSLANINTPFYFFHGSRDLVVPMRRGEAAFFANQKIHPVSRWKDYPVGHEICLEELRQVRFALHRHFSHRKEWEKENGAR